MWDALFLLCKGGECEVMRKKSGILVGLIVVIFLMSIFGCEKSTSKERVDFRENTSELKKEDALKEKDNSEENEVDDNTHEKDYSELDMSGRYEEDVSEACNGFGTISWNSELKSYVLTPNSKVENLMLGTLGNKRRAEYRELWNEFVDYLTTISNVYSCCICVENPSDNNKHILIVGYGEVAADVLAA